MKRDAQGRFLPGNKGGPGNPFAKRVSLLRKALLKAITEEDFIEVVGALVEKAKGGDVAAAKILFDRTLGPPIAADLLERIEQLEQQITGGGT
jgi:hypothetical protein